MQKKNKKRYLLFLNDLEGQVCLFIALWQLQALNFPKN